MCDYAENKELWRDKAWWKTKTAWCQALGGIKFTSVQRDMSWISVGLCCAQRQKKNLLLGWTHLDWVSCYRPGWGGGAMISTSSTTVWRPIQTMTSWLSLTQVYSQLTTWSLHFSVKKDPCKRQVCSNQLRDTRPGCGPRAKHFYVKVIRKSGQRLNKGIKTH